MVSAEACLRGGVEVGVLGNGGQALVHDGHENFGERGCNRNAPVVVHIFGVTVAFVEGGDLGVSPGLGGELGDGAVIEEVCEGVEG